ncbi:MAG TPA: hypothetical protein PLI59_16920 [Candidatus Obscuribacter sp.]|nr:hypothetical protein [Candidatus Obscuribacter sp.]HND67295.1 hypothetical protein [Candidatus Obscuribacter sp.]HNG20870.1 hypothetical protein [Candidatus Obscuribacter sp.]
MILTAFVLLLISSFLFGFLVSHEIKNWELSSNGEETKATAALTNLDEKQPRPRQKFLTSDGLNYPRLLNESAQPGLASKEFQNLESNNAAESRVKNASELPRSPQLI